MPQPDSFFAAWARGLGAGSAGRHMHEATRELEVAVWAAAEGIAALNLEAGRVLFASDYAILRQDRLARRVGMLLDDDDVLEHVMWRNAARVYGIDTPIAEEEAATQ